MLKVFALLENNSLVTLQGSWIQVNLCHRKNDDFIPYYNSKAAVGKWSNATLIDLTSGVHITAGAEFMLRYLVVWGKLGFTTEI